MNQPQFSVIIPTLNEEKFLPILLGSLVAQTEKNFEVLVVDGKSRDQTVALAKTFMNKLPLRVIHAPRRNVSHQRNLGAVQATGDWLVFVDADSFLFPYFFERLSDFIAQNKPEFVTPWLAPDSSAWQHALYALIGNIYLEASVRIHRPLSPGAMTIVTKKKFQEVRGYNENLTWGEDFDLSRRVAETGVEFMIIRETLYCFSQRRIRAYGAFSFLKTYIPGSLYTLLTNRAVGRMPGYVMGGKPYGKQPKTTRSKRQPWRFDRKVLALLRDLLD